MNNSWQIPQVSDVQKPKGVFFDWDNTLVHSHDATFQAFNRFLNRVGHAPLTREEARQRPPHSVRHWFPQLFGLEAPRMMDLYYEELGKIHLDSLALMEGCEDLLDYLAQAQVPMGVVSNKNGEILRKEIAHLGFDFYFTAAVGCFDTADDKPHPTPLYEALKKSYLSPGLDIWYVGDSVIDYDCALSAGCYPIIIPQGEEPPNLHFGRIEKNLRKVLELHQSLNVF